MKKIIAFLMAICMIISLTACSQSNRNTEGSSNPAANDDQISDESAPDNSNNSLESISDSDAGSTPKKILIAYFSYGENANLTDGVDASASASIQILDGKITGNTGLVANYIQKATGGDLFSIRTVKTYSDDYNTVIEEGQAEKNNNEKPELSSHIDNLDDYTTVFIGFPNWWYGMPMVMYSFLDEYDFSGKTIIPFCTSGGSAFSNAIDEIKTAEPNATVLDGLHISGSSASRSESEVSEWVNSLSLAK